ncbi:MAG: CotH kinase family protein, partial [Ignavibacteria bacterium]
LFVTPYFIIPQGIVINEIMSSNHSAIFDEYGEASDWIELYNSGSTQVNLEGYFLSDDSLNINKWQFGNAVIEPAEYLIVFASDKDTNIDYWHTNFKLNASGEIIILSDPDSSIIDQVSIPPSIIDISYARISDGSLPWVFQDPSPGSVNSGAEIMGYADSVSVSLPEGFYSSSASVELTAGTSDIFYTLDGSDPDSGSLKYSGPININETTVLKAISKKENHLPSPVIYRSYFINADTDLPVISLISDPYNLFDPDSGIYTNYTMDWERPAHVEFFEDDKSLGFSEKCGIEIYGSQSANWDQKSITVKFKNDYGASKIEYPLFPDFDVTTFKAFVLRNAGNDWQYTHIRDAVMQTLVKDLDIDYVEYRPATSFINGEYWGIYNIREKINEHYIANRHGVDPDNIDLLENNMTVIQGDSLSYRELIDYISTNDMTTDEAYSYLDSVIDLDECILYFAAQAYYDNMDWPGTNIKFWRERSTSGKWRWILFGLEFGFGLYSHGEWEDHIQFMFSPVETRYSNPPWATFLQRKLIENPTVRNRFINQIADLLNTNFISERVIELINRLANHISSEITKHRVRWDLAGEDLDKMISFAQNRPAYLRNHVRNYFNCGNNGALTINAAEGGSVQLNTLRLQSGDMPFSGIYFQGNEIHLEAIPAFGYKFDGWSGSATSTEKSISLSVTGSTNLYASFSIDTSAAKEIVINEINYNPANDFDSGDWIELYNISDQPIDISNWYFSDSDSSHKFIFPNGTVIEPDSYLVVVDNDSAFTSRFPDIKNYVSEIGFGLSGSGEFMKLANDASQIIDSLTYDDSLPWPVDADGGGSTLELIDAFSDNSLPENWRASINHGTPGKLNSFLSSADENESNRIPREFLLSQNYPNPFNPTTEIRYSIPHSGYVSLKVYNLLGQEIMTLFNGIQQPGNFEVTFDGKDLSSGIYIYQLRAEGVSISKKFILIK